MPTKELTTEQKQLVTIQELLTRHKSQIEMALPKHMTADRMLRVAITAAATTPELLKCDAKSFASCIVQAAILGLEPNTPLGEAYLVPYGRVCQLVPGWKGLIKLARNSGEVVTINAQEVRANDAFDFEDGLEPVLRHKRAPGGPDQRGPVVAYWAGALLQNGAKQYVVMTRDEVVAHAQKYSKAYGNAKAPWKTEFDAMALKTCVRKLCKYLPMSIEAQTACSLDERAEVGIPQQFSPELPLAFQPVPDPEPGPAGDPEGEPQPPTNQAA